MKDQLILENNALIAKYAGATEVGSYNNKEVGTTTLFYYGKGSIVPYYRCHSTETMKYNSSFDWLIPVIVKFTNDYCGYDYLINMSFNIELLYNEFIKALKEIQN